MNWSGETVANEEGLEPEAIPTITFSPRDYAMFCHNFQKSAVMEFLFRLQPSHFL